VLGVDPARPFHPHDDRRVNFGLHRNIDLGIAHDVIIDVPKVKRRREQSPESVSTGHRTLGRARNRPRWLQDYWDTSASSQNMDNSSPGPYH
jgi:hypothetical protein